MPISHMWDGAGARTVGSILNGDIDDARRGLDGIAEGLNSSWVSLHIDDAVEGMAAFDALLMSIRGRNSDPSIPERLVAGGFHLIDPRTDLLSERNGSPAACWQIIDAAALDRSPLVGDFLDRPENDLRWSLGFSTRLASGSRLTMGVSRSRSAGAYEEREIQQIASFSKHLTSAVEMREQLLVFERTVSLLTSDFRQGFESRKSAFIAVDARGRPAYVTAEGQEWLDSGVAIFSRSGVLTFRDPRYQNALEAALARKAETEAIRVGSREIAAIFRSVPAGSEGISREIAPVRAIIELVRLDVAGGAKALTRKEREVTSLLVEGLTPDDIAKQLNKSIETVRAQLKSAMRKYAVRSQAHLVSALLRGK